MQAKERRRCIVRASLRRYYEILSKYLKNQKLPFLLLTVFLFGSIGFSLIIPQIMRNFIDAVQSGKPMENLAAAALSFLGAALLQQVLSVSAAYMGSSVAWTATNALREDLASHCINLDISFHKEKSPGEFIERIEGDATAFNQFFSQLVLRLVGNVLLLAGILIALFLIDYRIGIVFTLFALAALFALNKVRAISVPRQKALREAETELFGFLEERLAGTEDIRSCGAVNYVINKLYQLHAVILKRWRKASLMNLVIGTTGGLMITVGFVMAILLGYNLYQSGMISLGTAFVILHYTTLLSRPIRELTQQVESMQNIGASVERIDELLSTEKKILEPADAVPIDNGPVQLDFDQVSFTYEGDEHPVINNLSFSIPQGKVLGLLGRTGGGKTTLARLIFRFYDPQAGSIRINGVDLREAKISDLRKCVAYVTQDVQLFQASVRDNITFFDSGISDDKLMEAIDALGLKSWFDSLPEGLDTRLETGGRSLSAGEAQLLALTRIFLKDPGLIILDEASSRLDPATEQLMEHALDKVLQGRTAIIIAHRLATIHRADDILILEEGEAAEYGNRLDLLSDPKSRFHSLYLTGMEESIA
jgi:ATP-binding cassette subfamily B protein